MVVTINEHHIKTERYSIVAKAFECGLRNLGINLSVTADTEVKNVGNGPETFVNFKFGEEQ